MSAQSTGKTAVSGNLKVASNHPSTETINCSSITEPICSTIASSSTSVTPSTHTNQARQQTFLHQTLASAGEPFAIQQQPLDNMYIQTGSGLCPLNQCQLLQLQPHTQVLTPIQPGAIGGLQLVNANAISGQSHLTLPLNTNSLMQQGYVAQQPLQVTVPGVQSNNVALSLCQVAQQFFGLIGQVLQQQPVCNPVFNQTPLVLQPLAQRPLVQLPELPAAQIVAGTQNSNISGNNPASIQVQVLNRDGEEIYNSSNQQAN